MNPDCAVGKHGACNGDGWDHDKDAPVACECSCHWNPVRAGSRKDQGR